MKKVLLILLYALARLVPGRRATVLVYHSISEGDFFAVPPEAFKKQLQLISARADIVPLEEVVAYRNGKRFPRDIVAITFDDGYRDFLDAALPILGTTPATLFLLTGAVDRTELGNALPLVSSTDTFPETVEIGSHGATHRKLPRLSEEEARDELEGSKRMIASAFGRNARYFAYPKGSWNARAAGLAQEAGYEAAFTVANRSVKRSDDLHALPRIQVDASTTPLVLRAKLTRAADWYEWLWRHTRRGK